MLELVMPYIILIKCSVLRAHQLCAYNMNENVWHILGVDTNLCHSLYIILGYFFMPLSRYNAIVYVVQSISMGYGNAQWNERPPTELPSSKVPKDTDDTSTNFRQTNKTCFEYNIEKTVGKSFESLLDLTVDRR